MSSELALMDDLELKTPVMHRPKSFKDFSQALFTPPEKDIFGHVNCGVRLTLVENFLRAAKLNADIQDVLESVRQLANPDFEVLGTNMTSALSLVDVEGGNVVTTAGADNDQAIIAPHLDTNQSAWTKVTWGADRETWFDACFTTGAAITTSILWVGLKLTNTPTVTTDINSTFIRYENAVNSGKWQANVSIANSDSTVDTGITVAAATTYRLRIIFDRLRYASIYMANGMSGDWRRVHRSASAFGTGVDLIPYFGVQANGAAAARSLVARRLVMSRLVGA